MWPDTSLMQLGAVGLDLLAATRLGPRGVAARQQTRLARLLDAARSGSAWYGRVLRGKSSAARLADIPPVTKAELMRHFAEWVTDPRLDLGALRDFTADAARIGQTYLGRYVVWESSGSSGEPGLFVQDAHALAVYDALEALRHSAPRPWQRLLDPLFVGERIAFIGATGGHFASQVSVQRLRHRYPWLASGLRSFSILQQTDALVSQLNAFAPTIVATYPTGAVLLADQARSGALHVRPRECWTGGETLSAAMRTEVRQALHCSVRNSYGASEFLSIAWECRLGRLHANSDWLVLEPVDRHYRPVPPGDAGHTTLLTNLANLVQPLIRYDLGDQVAFDPEPCACGSPLPALDVAGRCDDSLRMRSDDRRLVHLLPLALATVLEDGAGVFDFQLCQHDARTLELRVGPGGADASAAMQRARRVLQAYLQAQGLGAVRLVESPGVAPEHGRSGKVKRVLVLRRPTGGTQPSPVEDADRATAAACRP
jgi:phenylacetate-CoA ligase